MKYPKTLAAMLLLCSSLIFGSCSPNFDYLSTTKEIISQGNWSVGYFYADTDKTNSFSEYSFRFNNGGILDCKRINDSCTGKWKVAKDIEGNEVINMELTTQDASLLQLNGNWKVTGKNIANIALKTEGRGNGELKINKF
ncbi:MAG: hypothetical protein ABIN57_00290 [Chitinophagaceae bacterium]